MSDVDEPFIVSGSVSNPLTLDIKLNGKEEMSEESLLGTPILDLPEKIKKVIDKIIGKNITIKQKIENFADKGFIF